jgi:uncharacterized membrane protein
MSDLRSDFSRAVAVGAVCGMRTLLMPALVARSVPGSRAGTRILSLAAVGELLGDKLPFTPDRTEAPSLAARAVSGAVTAASLASRSRRPAMPSAVIAAASAILSAHLMIRLRKRADRTLPDPFVATVEDCLALVLANAVIRSAAPPRPDREARWDYE